PPLGLAGFEIRELSATDGINKKIAGLAVQGFRGARKSATELLQLRDIHERNNRRLTIYFKWRTGASLNGLIQEESVRPAMVNLGGVLDRRITLIEEFKIDRQALPGQQAEPSVRKS